MAIKFFDLGFQHPLRIEKSGESYKTQQVSISVQFVLQKTNLTSVIVLTTIILVSLMVIQQYIKKYQAHDLLIEYSTVIGLEGPYTYTPQPYVQLATTLKSMSESQHSDDPSLIAKLEKPEKTKKQTPLASLFLVFTILAVLALVLAILASFLHLLRMNSNPLYWQIACWFFIAVGILVRPLVVSGADVMQATISGTLIAGFISLVVFPGLMRFLNKLKPEPGLSHIAAPLSLGFFLDVVQLLTMSYLPGIPD